MAPAYSTLNRDNVTTSSPGNAGETSIPAGGNDRHGKRSSEEISPEGPSAVEVLLGGTPRAASEDTRAAAMQPRVTAKERVPGRQARALQKMTTAADAAAVLTAADELHQCNSANSQLIRPRDNSDNDDGEAPDNIARHRILAPAPPLPPLNPSPAATTFMRKGVRDQAEVFSAIQAHLRHVEFKLRNSDVEGALSNVAQVETLINKRFEVLLVADEAGFEAADRFQLYQAKSCQTLSYIPLLVGVVIISYVCRGFGGGQRQQQQTPSPQQLREWYFQRGGSGGGGTCPYVIRTGDRTGQTCGRFHTEQRCFFRLDDAWREQFPDAAELPRWADLLRKNIDIFALDFDAILGAMYALTISVEGDCYLSVPPDPGIGTSETAPPGASASSPLGPGEAAALGASASAALGPGEAAAPGACPFALAGTASTEALHTFTLDSGASRCFFRDRTALEQLARPVAVSLADPSGGPVIATSSTVLPSHAVPSGTLSNLYLPSFSTNLMAGSALQDGGVHQFTPAYERLTHCTCARIGRHLATFTWQPGSDLYTLTTESPQVAASASASGQLSAPCSCRSLSHQTVLWHHHLGHPSVQRLRGMHSRYLVSGLPRVLPPLPPSPAPPCLPCVEGWQRAAPHSSSFPPTEAPLQTLHLDMWGPARVCGQGHERYFLLVVDDYTRYTTVFPFRTKGEVPDVLIPWIRAARLQLRDRFQSDFPVLCLHSDRGGEFSSDLLAAYCAEHGIRQTFTLPASPQQNGVAEHRIGLVMEIARTSLIHAAAPHILWPFAVQYAAHQLNLWPRVSAPETSPTLLWTGQVGDASRFRVWGARAFVCDTTADKLSARAVPCVFLGFVPDAPGWRFYHPTSRRVFASQDVTFDEVTWTSDESVEPSGPYPELVGCLMYLMTCTRPDLAYPLGLLARYVAPARHRKVHWDAAKRVLRYLCSTSGMGLVLGGRHSVVLTGHSDASWVDDQAAQRSSQGYTFSLGSGSVSWRSTRSSSVLSSSCEAEIYATAMAAQELRWLTYLLTDLGERPSSPPVLYVDNKAAIALCQEHRLEHRTKHIALRYFLA
ncbi:unnamed protein product [Closterium sp. NIES-54]